MNRKRPLVPDLPRLALLPHLARLCGTVLLTLQAWSPASADVFKCQQADGQIVYQAIACAPVSGVMEKQTDWTRLREKEAMEQSERNRQAKIANEKRKPSDRQAQQTLGNPGAPALGDAVDCMTLYRYAKARGQNFIMASAIVEEARKTGRCVELKP